MGGGIVRVDHNIWRRGLVDVVVTLMLYSALLIGPRDPRELPLLLAGMRPHDGAELPGTAAQCSTAALGAARVQGTLRTAFAPGSRGSPGILAMDAFGRHADRRALTGVPRVRRLTILVAQDAVAAFGEGGITPDLALSTLGRLCA